MGDTIHELPLGNTGFGATVRAYHYTDTADTDPDFYSISVERRYESGSWVQFERQFPASSIPASFLTSKAHELVAFDPDRRLVTFTVGTTNYTCTLPPNR